MKDTFRVKYYEMTSSKIKGPDGLRFALLADLHGISYGQDNCRLLRAIRENHPDVILAAGDMIVREYPETLKIAERLMITLAADYPVVFSPGNHEKKMGLSPEFSRAYEEYEQRLKDGGVLVLKNQTHRCTLKETPITFYGLDLPMIYYHKPNSPHLSVGELTDLVGRPEKNALNVLLAHSPKYGKTYFSWGADLTVSGHYHGGVMRLSEHVGLTCPQFLLFPPYCCGDFHQDGHHMVVSAGLGEHTIPVRIHNPRELLFLDLTNNQN